jgi:hypothetical protein
VIKAAFVACLIISLAALLLLMRGPGQRCKVTMQWSSRSGDVSGQALAARTFSKVKDKGKTELENEPDGD